MPKLRARRATSSPMRPRPTMPSVLPRNSVPCSIFFSHLPLCSAAVAFGIWRAIVIIRPSVSSATATALAPGVFITTMPRLVAASASMLSTPTPARPITRSFGACSSSSGVTCTALRTTKASASASSPSRLVILSAVTTCQPGSSLKTASVAGETFSARTIFIELLSGLADACRWWCRVTRCDVRWDVPAGATRLRKRAGCNWVCALPLLYQVEQLPAQTWRAAPSAVVALV